MRQHNGSMAAPSADGTARALEEYLAAAEAGAAPPREEFLTRHPELAEDLDACLAALRFIGRAAEGPRSVAVGVMAEPPGQESGRLGDFRLIREVGRGGMGVVYEAEQVSLGRRVALKVLPFAATMDPRQLQRFHNEARAAASLDHPHIVHVHAVGCERAVHFYAMQYIEGQTLAAMIADLRRAGGKPVRPEEPPTKAYVPGRPAPESDTTPRAAASTERTPLDRAYFRRVADLGIQAAEALDHAHQLGIVHRDVKPANLLLDDRGGLWVTDFGLAHIQSDAKLTMTGDLVGTLRYMSPEQALAKRVVVDHRTDVYSLGATLYELLTLEPAFGGNDRQELLRQIAFEEPKAPRRLNRSIPAELETIVLKAMEKNPADRYATAKEVADDLRRFLADEPIRARRAGVVRRVRRWGRRHRAVVWSAALVALILSASLGWVLGDRQARGAEAEGRVKEALGVANASLPRGNPHDPELVTAARKAEAQLASGVVRKELRQQVERMLADMAMLANIEAIRLDQASVTGGHFDLAGADSAYAQAFRQYGIDVEALAAPEAGARIRERAIGLHLAAALDSWAIARWEGEKWARFDRDQSGKEPGAWKPLLEAAMVADPDPWRNSLRAALLNNSGKADLEKLADSAPIDELAPATVDMFGGVLRRAGAPSAAAKVLRRGQQRYPADFWINHELAFILANAMQPPQLDEAIGYYRAALALRPDSPGVHLNLGAALLDAGRLDRAIACFKEAIRLKDDYGGAYLDLGRALEGKGQVDDAIVCYKKTIGFGKDYCAEAHSNLGLILEDRGQLDEAIAEYHEALRLKKDYAFAHNNLGLALRAKGQLDDAIVEYRKALDLKKDYHEAHHNLGNALDEKGQFDEAIAELKEAIHLRNADADSHRALGSVFRHNEQLDEAIAEFRESLRLKNDSAASHYDLGITLAEKGQPGEAVPELRQAIKLDPRNGEAHAALGLALKNVGDLDGATAEIQRAIDLDPKLGVAHGVLGELLIAQGRFAEARTATLRSLELFPEPGPSREQGSRQLQYCERLLELDPKLPAVLSGQEQPASADERAQYASLCIKKKLYAAAVRLSREAIAAKPDLGATLLRYNAACAAALAGSGAGEDAAKLSDAERAGLRKQALDWLRADLDAWQGLLEKQPDKARPEAAHQLGHWMCDPDFNGVRGPDALAKLPEAERPDWQKLWQDVEALRQRAAAPPDKPTDAAPQKP